MAVFKDLSSIHVCPSLTVTSRSLLRYTTNFAFAAKARVAALAGGRLLDGHWTNIRVVDILENSLFKLYTVVLGIF